MSQFSFADWQNQSAPKQKSSGVKVGFFKLPKDGSAALVRFNISTPDDLAFATVHKVKRTPTDSFAGMSVSCVSPFGSTGACPLCEAANSGDDRVTKASKRVYVQMLVSYRDDTTGTWTPAVPVIWERSASMKAGFVSDLVSKLRDYGDLRNQLFKITKHGEKLDTQYSIDYAVPTIFKPEMVPADFSAFEGFNIAKHSYWEKTPEECTEYLRTGAFPEVTAEVSAATPVAATTVTTPVVSTPTPAFVEMPPVETSTPAATPVTNTPKSFGHYNF